MYACMLICLMKLNCFSDEITKLIIILIGKCREQKKHKMKLNKVKIVFALMFTENGIHFANTRIHTQIIIAHEPFHWIRYSHATQGTHLLLYSNAFYRFLFRNKMLVGCHLHEIILPFEMVSEKSFGNFIFKRLPIYSEFILLFSFLCKW